MDDKFRKTERGVRRFLDDWRFWMVIAFVGLAGTVVGLVVTFNQNAQDRAAREAASRANDNNDVNTCFNRATAAPTTARILGIFEDFIDQRLIEVQTMIDITPSNNVVRLLQLNQSRRRYERSKEDVQGYIVFTRENAPTLKECRILAEKLDVPIPKREAFTP